MIEIFLLSIELRLERISATSIARFSFTRIGRGRLGFCLYFPSLKQSRIEVGLMLALILVSIETVESTSNLALSDRLVPLGDSSMPKMTRLNLRSVD